MKTKSLWLFVAGLALAVMACTLLQLVNRGGNLTSTPAANPTLPPPTANRNPILADLQLPRDGGSYPAGGTLPVSIALNSQKAVQLVQVWLDGKLLTDSVPKAGARMARLDLPAAVLQGDGLHTLVVTAVDAEGRSTPANVVRVRGMPSVPMDLVMTTHGGESLQSIASHFNRDLSSVMSSNPVLLTSRHLSTGSETLAAGLQVVVPLGTPSAPAPEIPLGPLHKITTAPGLPAPPTVSTSANGCQVAITVGGTSPQATGYSLYRLDPDKGQFTKVAEMAASGKNGTISFSDQAAYGSPEYFVSAYNKNGETLSALQGVGLTDPQCQSSSGLPVDDGIVQLPAGVDQIYLYAAVNGGEYIRWPEKQGEFGTPQNGTLNLHDFANSVAKPGSSTSYPLQVQAEVWGWSGGQLVDLGTASARMDASNLVVCNLPGSCAGDVASTHKMTSIQVGSDSQDQAREFTWTTSISKNPVVLFQLSLMPFAAGYDAKPPGLVYSQLVVGSSDGSSGGTFDVNFAHLKQGISAALQTHAPLVSNQAAGLDQNNWLTAQMGWVDPSSTGWNYSALTLTNPRSSFLDLPVTYYGRIIPMNGSQPSGPASNTVTIDYERLGPPATLQLVDDIPPPIYDIHIDHEFTAPIRPTLWWGCVYVVSINPDSSYWKGVSGGYYKSWYTEALQNHYALCPTSYKGEGEKPWYEQLWDVISEGFSLLAKVYDAIKSTIVNLAADALNGISGGLCGDTCKEWLTTGLDAGLAALGIPPDMPDLSKLTDDGIAALVEEGANAIGVGCGQECEDVLTGQLKSLKDQVLQQQVSSYGDAEEAHNHGLNPMVLPPSDAVQVTPAPEANWQMATTTITVTRHADSGQYSVEDLNKKYKYRIVLTVEGKNDWMVGQTIPVARYTCYNDASMWPCDYLDDPVTETLTGELFHNAQPPLPHLVPGETSKIIVTLVPTVWWYKNHQDYAANTWAWYNEWCYLWYHGTATMNAEIAADGVQLGGPYTFAISRDGPWQFDLPVVNVQGIGGPQ